MRGSAAVRALALAVCVIGLLVAAIPAGADTMFAVNSEADFPALGDTTDGVCEADDGDVESTNVCTLRAAVQEANGTAGADTISLPDGTYTLTLQGSEEDQAATGDLDVTSGTTINGESSAGTVINGTGPQAEDLDRVFDVRPEGDLAISEVTIRLGKGVAEGGAVRNEGTLAMTNLLVADSETDAGGEGGGLYNDGEAVLSNVAMQINHAARGGAIYNSGEPNQASLELKNFTLLTDNRASDGGGIYNLGVLTLSDSYVGLNTAFDEGGGIYNAHERVVLPDQEIVDVHGQLTVTDSAIEENDAGVDTGGGIYNDGKATITNSSISRNTTFGPRGGGGIFNGGVSCSGDVELTLTRSVVADNLSRSGHGGGITNDQCSLLDVLESTISGNYASDDGGGVFNGGLFHLTRSTVSGNGVYVSEGTQYTWRGGGIANEVANFQQASVATQLAEIDRSVPTLVAVNSTISGNAAVVRGGGLFNSFGPTSASLDQVTLTANKLIDGSGSNIWFDGESFPGVKLRATIVSGGIGSDNCEGGSKPVSAGHNLEDADTCGLNSTTGDGDLVNANPKLGALGGNGGPTMTHALLDGSPAIDTAGTSGCPATDQRGVSRPQGPACDIGAYERLFQAPTPQPTPTPTPPPPPPATTPPPPQPTVPRRPRAVRRCTVPNVRGKTVRAAKKAIAKAGCKGRVMGRRASIAVPPGHVLNQSIRPGARVRRGTIVRLILSRHQQPVRPPFTG